MIKKVGRYFLYTVLGILLALMLFPFVFKNKIVRAFENAVNDEINAVVTFKDIDISFLRSFPDLNLGVQEISVVGRDTFEGVPLLKAKELSLDVNLFSLFKKGSNPTLDYIGLNEANVQIIILPNGEANYNITKIDTLTKKNDTVGFVLDLEKYAFKNSNLTYTDQSMPMYVALKNVQHEGSGRFSDLAFDLNTKTKTDSCLLRYDGIEYIKNAKVDLDAIIFMDHANQKYSLKENKLKINELYAEGEGFVQFMDDLMNLEIKAKTPFEDIRQLISILPNVYTSDFSEVKTKGKASIDLDIKGVYDGAKQHYPAFKVKVKVDNGYILYPGSPFPLENVNLDLTTGANRPDYKDLFVDIPAFQFLLNKEKVTGLLRVNNATEDQNFSGELKGRINLGDMKQALQLNSFEKLQGVLDMNFTFASLMSYITREEYSKITAKGSAVAKNLLIKTKEAPAILVAGAIANFSPEKLDFDLSQMKMGSSTVSVKGMVVNPLSFFTLEKPTRTTISFFADKFNMDEWVTPANVQNNNQSPELVFTKKQEDFFKKSSLDIEGTIGQLKSGNFNFIDVALKAVASANLIEVQNFSARADNSDIAVRGTVQNVFDYVFNEDVLLGKLVMNSKYFDTNLFSGGQEVQDPATKPSTYDIPERMKVEISGKFDKLLYTDMLFSNVSATFHVQEEEVVIKDFITDAFGGQISMNGLYNTSKKDAPTYSVKLDLFKMKFEEALRQFDVFKKLMPVAAYLEGYFNTTLVMKGNLTAGMDIDLGTLDASGFIETLYGKLRAFPPLHELGKQIQIKEIQDIDLTDTKNWFEIVQGMVDLKPFQKSVQGIAMDVSGKHDFAKGMDYEIIMKIPRVLLEKNKVTSSLNKGMSLLDKEAKKLGIDLKQGDFINLKANLTGKLLKPSIKVTLLPGDGTSSYQEALEESAKNAGQKVIDSIRTEVNKAKEKARDSLTKVIKKEADKAKTKVEKEAEKIITETKTKAKEQVINQIDTLTKGVISDSLKQKAKDVLDKNVDKEIDKIKDKLKDFDPFKKKKKD